MTWATEEPPVYICEHVGYSRYMVIAGSHKGRVEIKCPCCGMHGYQDPEDDINEGPPCPYCYVQPVLA